MPSPRWKAVSLLLFLLGGLIGFHTASIAQIPQTGAENRVPTRDFLNTKWTGGIDRFTTPLNTVARQSPNAAVCTNSTFYFRLPSAPGETIELAKLQTFPDGNYLIAGTVTNTGGFKEGLLLVLSNDGIIVSQKRIRVNNKPTIIEDARIAIDGDFYISGRFNDGSNAIFLARLKNDLSFTWTKSVSELEVPVKVKLGIYDESYIAIAVQLSNSVSFSSYDLAGNLQWYRNTTPPSLLELVGINELMMTKLGLVTNCLNNGRRAVQVSEIDKTNGAILASHFQGNLSDDSKALSTTPFDQRLNILGVTGGALGTFEGFRYHSFASNVIETFHNYRVLATPDFAITGQMDNAGDALGYFIPTTKRLIFIKHFSTSPSIQEFVREYVVPEASSINGLTRSFDGGFLFGLNADLSNEIVLIKTDSSGILPGCGYQTLTRTQGSQNMFPNTATTSNVISPFTSGTMATVANFPSTLTGAFQCKQNYCPPAPFEDTCLSTYYKTFRSGNYFDFVYDYFLMNGNNHLLNTAKYDRILGGMNLVTHTLKLLDEKGNFLKAVSVNNPVRSQIGYTYQMDNRELMMVSNVSRGNIEAHNFTLIDDNLNVIWSKSINTNREFYSSGMGVSDVHKDAEGNYYAVSTIGGFFNKAKVFVYKMGPNGNEIWNKAYEFDNRTLGPASITSTASSIIIVIESGDVGNISVRLDKITGQLLNSYSFGNNWDNLMYTRMLKYSEGRIFYAGSDKNSRFLMGTLDTTGKPIRMKSLSGSELMRAANVKNGSLYAMFFFNQATSMRDVFLKVDTGLNIQFFKEYPRERYRLTQGIGISDEGYLYNGGNFSYGESGSYNDPYIVKYGPNGELGICTITPITPVFTDIPPAPVPLPAIEVLRTYTPLPEQITLVPETSVLHIHEILCSSLPTCTSLDLTDIPPVCQLNTDITLPYSRNVNCNLEPVWIFDPSFAELKSKTNTSVTFSFKKTGNIWIKARLNTGCNTTIEDSTYVSIQDSPAALSLGPDKSLCPGDSIVLRAGPSFAQYSWQDGSTDSIYVARQAGRYYVQVTNSCGDTKSDTVDISAAILPSLSLGPDQTVCRNDTLLLQASPGFNIYDWQPNNLIIGSGPTVKVVGINATNLTVHATTIDGCSASDTISIQVLIPQQVYLGSDTSFCQSDSIVLNAGAGYTEYLWNNGSSNSSIIVKTAGSYHVRVKDINECYARDTLRVLQTYSLPALSLGADRDLCIGNTLLFDAGNFKSYQWQDGSTNRTYQASGIGKYWVAVTDINNCRGSDTIQILNLNPLPTNFLKSTDTVCKYGDLTIIPSKTYNSYQWSTGSTQSTITIDRPGQYILTATDNKGCTGKDTIVVIQKDCLSGVFIPNAFTPNGDRNNQVFRAKVYGPLVKFSLQVYNRYGQLIFATTDAHTGWDGSFKGQKQAMGTFVWQCSYQFEGRTPEYKKGVVILIR